MSAQTLAEAAEESGLPIEELIAEEMHLAWNQAKHDEMAAAFGWDDNE